jgi:hypothetical protein
VLPALNLENQKKGVVQCACLTHAAWTSHEVVKRAVSEKLRDFKVNPGCWHLQIVMSRGYRSIAIVLQSACMISFAAFQRISEVCGMLTD